MKDYRSELDHITLIGAHKKAAGMRATVEKVHQEIKKDFFGPYPPANADFLPKTKKLTAAYAVQGGFYYACKAMGVDCVELLDVETHASYWTEYELDLCRADKEDINELLKILTDHYPLLKMPDKCRERWGWALQQ